MGKSKEIRKKTLLERLASERAAALEREKALSGAVTKLRAALIVYAKGENWAHRDNLPWALRLLRSKGSEYVWLGDGNPEGLAKATIAAVFGKDHPLTGEVMEAPHEKT